MRYTDINEVRAGDAILMRNDSEGEHWFVVLGRTGNSLYTAEGNFGGKVNVSNSRYTISGDRFSYHNRKGKTTARLEDGYHYTGGPIDNSPVGCLDVAEGRINAVFVSGWAFDRDTLSQAVELHDILEDLRV